VRAGGPGKRVGGDTGTAPWADLTTEGCQALAGASPPAELAAAMHGAWVDFARTGRPGRDAYDRGTRATMTFDVDSRLVHDPRPGRRMVWDGVR